MEGASATLEALKVAKKRARDTISELAVTASEQARISSIFEQISALIAQLPENADRAHLLTTVESVATRYKQEYRNTQNVIMTLEKEISVGSEDGEEEGKKKRKGSLEDVPVVEFQVMPKDTFVVPVFSKSSGAEPPLDLLVATSHLSRAYLMNRTDVSCKSCIQSRNESLSGWFSPKTGFNIQKYRLDPSIEEQEVTKMWKIDGYDIKASKSAMKFISLDEARAWYAKDDIGHAKQIENIKKSCTHHQSPVKKNLFK